MKLCPALRPKPIALVVGWACLFALLAAGCSSGTDKQSVVPPAGPATLLIDTPSANSCVLLQNDTSLSLRAKITTTNWAFRPPGACGPYAQQCGYAVFFIDGQRLTQTSAPAVDIPMQGLASPTGAHTLRVELHDDLDQLAKDIEQHPLFAEVSFQAGAPQSADCGNPLPDAGADAAEDAAADAPIEADAAEDGAADADSAAEDAADAPIEASAEDASDAPIEASAEDASADASAE